MDSFERRSRFIHKFATPLTTLNAGLSLLERHAEEQAVEDDHFTELLALLNRSALRLSEAIDMLKEHMLDHQLGIQVLIPESVLGQSSKLNTSVSQRSNPTASVIEIPKDKPVVLLIEDSATYRAVMSARLLQAGYHVITATDGMAGLDLARQFKPVVIILDLMLPHLNGEQVAFVMGEDPETKHIPIIIYTSLEAKHTTHLDPRLKVVRKDEALDRLPLLISELIHTSGKQLAAQILVIDDDPELRAVLERGLTEAGYGITLAANGTEGLHVATRQPFDLIMLDLMLPDVDGWTVLQQLRERTQTATTPTMLISAISEQEDKVRGLHLGADDYVTKPFDWNELLARISSSLRRREVEGNANPSTMLPGNRSIERAIMARVENHIPFAIGYCDLDNFKAYNDEYGFLKGDAIIHQTARIITAIVEKFGNKGDFVGHIGGDDFIFLTHPDNVVPVCEHIIAEFDQLAPLYYDLDSRQRGYIDQVDREGNPKKFPFVSISIGVLTNLKEHVSHFAQIGDLAADVKKRSKAHPGSIYFIEDLTESTQNSLAKEA